MNADEEIKQWRAARRDELLARRLSLTPSQHRQLNDAITQRLLSGFPILQWMIVSFYWPIKREFDPRFAVREWRRHGATAALPVVVQKRAPLQFRQWWPGVPVTKGVYDLPVPIDTPVLCPQAVLIPPVGFDAAGYRLGYGGGYFDRTLAAMTPQPLKIGVAFELSRMETIRPQHYDVPMDFIVTEDGIHHVSRQGLICLADPSEASEFAEQIIGERDRAYRPEIARAGGGDGPGETRLYASPTCYLPEFDPDPDR